MALHSLFLSLSLSLLTHLSSFFYSHSQPAPFNIFQDFSPLTEASRIEKGSREDFAPWSLGDESLRVAATRKTTSKWFSFCSDFDSVNCRLWYDKIQRKRAIRFESWMFQLQSFSFSNHSSFHTWSMSLVCRIFQNYFHTHIIFIRRKNITRYE